MKVLLNCLLLTKLFLCFRLELTKEKNAMLKEKLDYIIAEKENDIKTFHEIISNSKNALVEMILAQHQPNVIGEERL